MSLEVDGTFVSQKINKIRWIPEEYVETKHFFTGSWDDDENYIKVWLLEHINEDDDGEDPRQISEYKVAGDVTEIKFLDKNKIAVSISNGEVRILEISAYERQAPLKEVFEWKQLHKIEHDPCSCTSLDTFEGDIASVGEDGKVNILNGRRGDITSTLYHSADSCSLHSVCFIKSNEVITGNIRGHMKIWDIRSDNQKPAASFVLSTDELAATCIVQHPTQPHIVLAGSESGFIAVWDLRINQFPTTLVNAHSAGVTEMQFHPENPYRLLTSSVSGDIWDWDMELLTKKTPDSYLPIDEKTTMNVNSIITLRKSVNTIHCDKGRILCGCDNEALYLIKNFKF
ncbi:nucleoporin Nup43 [Colias croceus]|uniref:nucleoporin Nup43 n=1 Tax=Colias crocea TaxID=72248 RepID=UPI001E27E234|nr:nucleoporin Nup43 [Colias croceus]